MAGGQRACVQACIFECMYACVSVRMHVCVRTNQLVPGMQSSSHGEVRALEDEAGETEPVLLIPCWPCSVPTRKKHEASETFMSELLAYKHCFAVCMKQGLGQACRMSLSPRTCSANWRLLLQNRSQQRGCLSCPCMTAPSRHTLQSRSVSVSLCFIASCQSFHGQLAGTAAMDAV